MGKKQLLQIYSREYETTGEFIKPGRFNSLPSEKAGEGAIWMRLSGSLYSVRGSPQMGAQILQKQSLGVDWSWYRDTGIL